MVAVYQLSRGEKKILRGCHVDPTAGHMGRERTYNRRKERFKWTGMYKDDLKGEDLFAEQHATEPSILFRKTVHDGVSQAVGALEKAKSYFCARDYCLCRLPKSGRMAECTICGENYHRKCVGIIKKPFCCSHRYES